MTNKQYDVFSNKFSYDIFLQKYSLNGQESWEDTARRVTSSVCGQLLSKDDQEEIFKIIKERKFIPGGRYLYSSGRSFHQVNNCFLFRAEDSREGWSNLMYSITSSLMTGGGIGIDYSLLRPEDAVIKRTGGKSTGPIALMNMVNEAGRHIMQGGQRRSAIWAGLQWDHQDIFKYIDLKNHTELLKNAKLNDLNFHLPMELTNISVIYNTEFFIAIEDINHPKHILAKSVWKKNCYQAFSTAEPGMSFNFCKDAESLRNAPVAASTRVLTRNGYVMVGDIVNKEISIWTGKQWTNTTFKRTKENSDLVKVELSNGRSIVCDPEHPFIAKHYIGAGKKKKTKLERIEAKNLCEDQKILSTLPLDTIFDNRKIHNIKEYGLGFVFGDGNIKDGRGDISYHDESKRDSFLLALDGLNAKLGKNNNRAYFKVSLDSKLELLNTSTLSPDFISGWFDADGCLTRDMLRISNHKKESLLKLQESLDFYGIKSVVREDGNSSYKPENKMYTLGI